MKNKKVNALYDMDYKSKRDFLRKFASYPEIEQILDIMVDEILLFDDKLLGELDLSVLNNIIEDDEIKFLIYFKNKIFEMYDNKIFEYLRTFLIDGYLAFEIIYNENNNRIIGFKELDSTSLKPDVELRNGILQKVWIQYGDIEELRRVLTDSQIIYVSYSKNTYSFSKTSYVERLVRTFNHLRIIENLMVIKNLSSDIIDTMDIDDNIETNIKYFKDKLIQDSRLPYSRFSENEKYDEKEEFNFSRFKEKIKLKFQEIFIKPLWIQFCIDYPELQHSEIIKQNLKITF